MVPTVWQDETNAIQVRITGISTSNLSCFWNYNDRQR